MKLIALTLTLWLSLAAPALAEGGAHAAGKIFGYLLIPALLILGIFLLIRRSSRRN